MASAVTLLPQPDLPTIPSVRPRCQREAGAVHGLCKGAAIALKGDPQILDREQRSRDHW